MQCVKAEMGVTMCPGLVAGVGSVSRWLMSKSGLNLYIKQFGIIQINVLDSVSILCHLNIICRELALPPDKKVEQYCSLNELSLSYCASFWGQLVACGSHFQVFTGMINHSIVISFEFLSVECYSQVCELLVTFKQGQESRSKVCFN